MLFLFLSFTKKKKKELARLKTQKGGLGKSYIKKKKKNKTKKKGRLKTRKRSLHKKIVKNKKTKKSERAC